MIVLVKHSEPSTDAGVPPQEWALSTAGRRRCVALAASLRSQRLTHVVTSSERKAHETAEIVSTALAVPLDVDEALREHGRPALPVTSDAEFRRNVLRAFERPTETLYGGESLDVAVARVATAVESWGSRLPSARLAFVTHGTVLAGFVARATGTDGARLWSRLALPSWVAIDPATRTVTGSWRADGVERDG